MNKKVILVYFIGLFLSCVKFSLASQDSKDMNFPFKLYELLESGKHSDKIYWMPSGKCFAIAKEKIEGEEEESYHLHSMKLTKRRSLLRQINLYGFSRISKGSDKGCYFHPNFSRDHPQLLQYVIKTKVKPLDDLSDMEVDGLEEVDVSIDFMSWLNNEDDL